jgi:hypothetical protein
MIKLPEVKRNFFATHLQYQNQHHGGVSRSPAYKLPPDVELSKTTSPDEETKSSKLDEPDLPATGSEPISLKRSASLHRRESSGERSSSLHRREPSGESLHRRESSGERLKVEPHSPQINTDEFKSQNGLVTLSRFVRRLFNKRKLFCRFNFFFLFFLFLRRK